MKNRNEDHHINLLRILDAYDVPFTGIECPAPYVTSF
jgi:hypothetical protein